MKESVPKIQKPKSKDDKIYDRNQEKQQEIGDEFLNPDKEMEESAMKIQKFYRARQTRKSNKEKDVIKEVIYDRGQEKEQEIGDEFLNPDKEMEESAMKIQKFYRARQTRKNEKVIKVEKKDIKKVEKIEEKKDIKNVEKIEEKKDENYDRD